MPVQWLAVALKRAAAAAHPGSLSSLRLPRCSACACASIGAPVGRAAAADRRQPCRRGSTSRSITSLAPVVFVAKSEVAGWPVFGLLARLQRTVFVDRDRRQQDRRRRTREIAQRLAEGDTVVLFAEGTSSDGNRVLPFRTALIGAARDAIAAAGSRARSGSSRCRSPMRASTACRSAGSIARASPGTATSSSAAHLATSSRTGAIDVVVQLGRADRLSTARPTARRLAQVSWNPRCARLNDRGAAEQAARPPDRQASSFGAERR